MEKWLSRQAHNLKFVGSNPTSVKISLVLFSAGCDSLPKSFVVCEGGCSLMVKCWLVAPRDMGSTPVIPGGCISLGGWLSG